MSKGFKSKMLEAPKHYRGNQVTESSLVQASSGVVSGRERSHVSRHISECWARRILVECFRGTEEQVHTAAEAQVTYPVNGQRSMQQFKVNSNLK